MSDDFDYDAFQQKLETFVDEDLIPDGEVESLLTVPAITALLRRLRAFFDAEGVPAAWQAEYVGRLIQPFIASWQPISDAERADVRREWSEALGFDVPFLN